MEHIKVTNADIVEIMSDETKRKLANLCSLKKTQPELIIELVVYVMEDIINREIDLCNSWIDPETAIRYETYEERFKFGGII
jgi:hypothetical protein